MLNVLKPLRRLLVVLPLLVLMAACASKVATSDATSAPGGRGGGAPAPVPVQTAKAAVQPMPIVIGAVGTAEAVSSVDVRSRVSGQLGEIHFTEGQEVRKGQLLFELDARPFDAALRQTDALFKQGLISQQDHDMQVAAAGAAEATVATDQAQVDQAKLSLQYCRISAPMDGRTGALHVHPGDLVSTGDPNPLITINQLSPIYITFTVPGRFLADIQRFQAQNPLTVIATPQSSASPGAQPSPAAAGAGANNAVPSGPTAEGKVAFIDNSVDSTTGSIKLKAKFPNVNRSLWPGLFAQVSLRLSTEERAIVVPAIAVQMSQQGQYVYVVKADRTVEMRPVTVERQYGEQAVISGGLATGEEVVTDGQLRLSPGVHVTTAAPGAAATGKTS
jgi:multidrug efflux system membrane fusion protein